MASDNRKRSRVPLELEAVLSCGTEKTIARVVNLSLKGALCEAQPGFAGQGECLVIFRLGDGSSFRIEARLVRHDERGIALDFTGMDEEAFLHLRNLVRYHAQDPDEIDRELARPAFDPRASR